MRIEALVERRLDAAIVAPASFAIYVPGLSLALPCDNGPETTTVCLKKRAASPKNPKRSFALGTFPKRSLESLTTDKIH